MGLRSVSCDMIRPGYRFRGIASAHTWDAGFLCVPRDQSNWRVDRKWGEGKSHGHPGGRRRLQGASSHWSQSAVLPWLNLAQICCSTTFRSIEMPAVTSTTIPTIKLNTGAFIPAIGLGCFGGNGANQDRRDRVKIWVGTALKVCW